MEYAHDDCSTAAVMEGMEKKEEKEEKNHRIAICGRGLGRSRTR